MANALLVSIDLDQGAEILPILDGAGHKVLVALWPPVLILPMTDPFVRALRRYFGKAKGVEGMRLGGQTIGNRWVEDAYVYRVS